LHDARGARVKLTRCRGCGIMHRFDASCHWCGPLEPRFRLSPQLLRSAAVLALVAGTAAGVWRAGPTLRAAASTMGREIMSPSAPALTVADNSAERGGAPTASPTVAPIPTDSLTYNGAADGALVAAGDSIQWTPAVARTWVNVRSDASRGGEVVGVIKPASRAMLGTDRAGWRQVRSADVSGWVDPRHFEPDSLRTRGE
jgi:hypothetical protein